MSARTRTARKHHSDESVRRILDGVAEALGGWERLSEVRTFQASGTTTFVSSRSVHVCGYWQNWCRSTQAGYRQETDVAGGIHFERVLESGQGPGWMLTPQDQVTPLEGPSLQELTSVVYLLSGAWLFPDRMAGEIRLIEEFPPKKLHLLEVLPENGAGFTILLQGYLPRELVWLSKAAADPIFEHLRFIRPVADLLSRVKPGQDAQSDSAPVIRFLEWTEVKGIKIPSRYEQISGPNQKKLSRVSDFKLNPRIPEEFFGKPEPLPPVVQFPEGRDSEKAPFRLVESRPIVDVKVGGQGPFPFFLDTGTSASMLDRALAKELGLKPLCGFSGNMGGGAGVTRMDLVQGVQLDIGELSVQPRNLMVFDLGSASQQASGLRVLGILGGSFIRHFVLDLDYESREATYFDPAAHSWKERTDRIKVAVQSGVPFVKTQSTPPQDVQETMMIDTGADMCLLFTKPFVDQHGLLKEVSPSISTVTFGIGGELKMRVGRLSQAQLGPNLIESPLAGLALQAEGTLGQAGFAGILGGQVLSRFRVRLDYGGGWMSLKPTPGFEEPYHFDMSGLVLTSMPPAYKTFEVAFVVEGSPAAEAGLYKGDEVVSIDGRPSRDFPLPDLTAMLRESGREVSLGVRRGGKPLSMQFVTRKLI